MNWMEACRESQKLYQMWVGKVPSEGVNLDRIHTSMLQDYRWRRNKPQFSGVVREIRGQFVLLGKIRKVLATD